MSLRTVLCFGDSNTHGTPPMATLEDDARFDLATRWPGQLQTLLGEEWRVIEEGLPGRTTVHSDPVEGAHLNGLTVLPALLASHRPLDLVVIMLGTNDLKTRFAVTALDIALSAERLLATVAASGAGPSAGAPGVLLVAPPPIVETGCLAEIFIGGAPKSHQVARHMRDAAARAGARFLDAGAHIAVSPIDGIHFDAAAHARLAEAVAAAITT